MTTTFPAPAEPVLDHDTPSRPLTLADIDALVDAMDGGNGEGEVEP